MESADSVSLMREHPGVDYPHLPGEEGDPLMESPLHVDWVVLLINAVRHQLAGTDNLVTGNVGFAPDDGKPHQAPDLMVIPGAAGKEFGRYEPGPNDALPSVCIEVLSPSNTRADIERRSTRLLKLGVPEVYVLDPRRDTVLRMYLASDGSLTETSALGMHSHAMALSFGLTDNGKLALCCPAGRVVRPGDDPFGWVAEEMHRADAAESRADAAESLADAEARRAEAEARRAEAEARRAEAEARRAEAASLRADEAEQRSAALATELERLRRLLPGSDS